MIYIINRRSTAICIFAVRRYIAEMQVTAMSEQLPDETQRCGRRSLSHPLCSVFWLRSENLKTGAADAVAAVLRQRSNSDNSNSNRRSDWKLTEQEEAAVTDRVCGVEANLMELRFMLATAVER